MEKEDTVLLKIMKPIAKLLFLAFALLVLTYLVYCTRMKIPIDHITGAFTLYLAFWIIFLVLVYQMNKKVEMLHARRQLKLKKVEESVEELV